jgi:hypothetical protein
MGVSPMAFHPRYMGETPMLHGFSKASMAELLRIFKWFN